MTRLPSLDQVQRRLVDVAHWAAKQVEDLPPELRASAFNFICSALAAYAHPQEGPLLLQGLTPTQIVQAEGKYNVSS